MADPAMKPLKFHRNKDGSLQLAPYHKGMSYPEAARKLKTMFLNLEYHSSAEAIHQLRHLESLIRMHGEEYKGACVETAVAEVAEAMANLYDEYSHESTQLVFNMLIPAVPGFLNAHEQLVVVNAGTSRTAQLTIDWPAPPAPADAAAAANIAAAAANAAAAPADGTNAAAAPADGANAAAAPADGTNAAAAPADGANAAAAPAGGADGGENGGGSDDEGIVSASADPEEVQRA
ncbi:hypothetical protein Agub_g12754 [Astrephomene gubernaculifera]|uniref:Uncharacterized protein n=1 Tax=Astrephomene gubernaculifera TaxID=47775 RepID=A0AAD3DYR1_9CHLO|nr:hypothetical protein Agub_g12754 [Astrephomene gubernaculifera]